MPCGTNWRASRVRGGQRGSRYPLGKPAKCVFCSARRWPARAHSPSLSGESCVVGSVFRFCGTPMRGRKPRSTEISYGQLLQALPHYFCFLGPPRQQGAESDCATPPLPVSTLIQSVRGRLRPLPRPRSPRPTLPFLGRTCSLSILSSLRVPGA